MLEITIGALMTLLGVAFGCLVLELTMRVLRHSLNVAGRVQSTDYLAPVPFKHDGR